MQSVAILTTSCNDREQLLSVLKDCYIQIDEMKNDENYSFSVYLLDDESTDGTFDAVTEKFPHVKILRTDASDEWQHGVRTIWEKAEAEEHPDFFLAIDHRIHLHKGAVASLMETSKFLKHKALIAGTISDPDQKYLFWGGVNKHGKLLVPDDILPIPCATFDGMFVLIPQYVYQTIGNLDPIFRYKYADNEYGIRAKKNGITVVTAPGVLGSYDQNITIPIWRNASYPLVQRYRALYSPEGCPPNEKFIYDLHKCGLIGAIGHNISIWVKVLFPKRKAEEKTRNEK